MGTGRPSKYNAEFFPRLVYWMCRCGLTDSELATELDISEATLNKWKNEKVGFVEAIAQGKNLIDSQVENALLRCALGFSQEEEKPFCTPRGDHIVVQFTRKYKPDAEAGKWWLKNRNPKRWKDHPEDNSDSAGAKLEKLINAIRGNIQPVAEDGPAAS